VSPPRTAAGERPHAVPADAAYASVGRRTIRLGTPPENPAILPWAT